MSTRPALGRLVDGLGALGRAALVTALRNAAIDQGPVERLAAAMYSRETSRSWPPQEVAERALWTSRAAGALVGLVEYLKSV